MKKIYQALICILCLTITLTFTASVFAQNVCVIQVETDFNPLYRFPTLETTRTEQATREAYRIQFGQEPPHLGEIIWFNCSFDYAAMDTYECWDGRPPVCYYEGVSIAGDFFTTGTSPMMPTCEIWGSWDVVCGPDLDDDSFPDIVDNCPTKYNPDQADENGDGVGDVCEATLIELVGFEAVASNRKVTLNWQTASEVDNAGFNLYRSIDGSDYEKINADLIPAEGSPTGGSSYSFVDTYVQNRTEYSYLLEDFDLNGTVIQHGPVSATPRWIYGINK